MAAHPRRGPTVRFSWSGGRRRARSFLPVQGPTFVRNRQHPGPRQHIHSLALRGRPLRRRRCCDCTTGRPPHAWRLPWRRRRGQHEARGVRPLSAVSRAPPLRRRRLPPTHRPEKRAGGGRRGDPCSARTSPISGDTIATTTGLPGRALASSSRWSYRRSRFPRIHTMPPAFFDLPTRGQHVHQGVRPCGRQDGTLRCRSRVPRKGGAHAYRLQHGTSSGTDPCGGSRWVWRSAGYPRECPLAAMVRHGWKRGLPACLRSSSTSGPLPPRGVGLCPSPRGRRDLHHASCAMSARADGELRELHRDREGAICPPDQHTRSPFPTEGEIRETLRLVE